MLGDEVGAELRSVARPDPRMIPRRTEESIGPGCGDSLDRRSSSFIAFPCPLASVPLSVWKAIGGAA